MPSSAADQTIDELLERYLGLVDQYTMLREDLARAQQSMFHSLARANFTSDRGVRYGQDDFDERMQASRHVAISHRHQPGDDDGAQAPSPTFTIIKDAITTEEPVVAGDEDDNDEGGDDTSKGEREQPQKAVVDKGNPIRWFGVLVPQALRDAQGHAIRAVEDIIPRVVSVEAEMAAVEIEVRRARKKRTKAAAAAGASANNKKQLDITGTAVSASS